MATQQPKVDPNLIRELWVRELTNVEIAGRLGLNRRTVAKWLRRAGLAGHGLRAPSARARQRLALARQAAAAGVRSLRSVNPDAYLARYKALATAYGLPADLRPVQVAVLVTLAGGPLTTRRLADLFSKQKDGKAYQAFGNNHCGNYLRDLRRRGLVGMASLCRGKGYGRGRGDGQWFLTAHAMDLLTSAKEDSHADPVP